MYESPQIKFYIIGMRENFRGAALLSELQDLSLQVEIIWGCKITELPPATSAAMKLQQILYGRVLTLGERACNRAHAKAVRRAHEDSFDISVILEDDAQIPDSGALLCALRNSYQSKKPYLLNLFHHEPLRFRNPKSAPDRVESAIVIPAFIIPTATVGYAVNKVAVKYIMTKIDEPPNRDMQADYPLYYGDKIQFKIAHPVLIGHNYGLESVIQTRGSQANTKFRFKRWSWLLIGLFPCTWRSNYSGIRGYSKFLLRILLVKLNK